MISDGFTNSYNLNPSSPVAHNVYGLNEKFSVSPLVLLFKTNFRAPFAHLARHKLAASSTLCARHGRETESPTRSLDPQPESKKPTQTPLMFWDRLTARRIERTSSPFERAPNNLLFLRRGPVICLAFSFGETVLRFTLWSWIVPQNCFPDTIRRAIVTFSASGDMNNWLPCFVMLSAVDVSADIEKFARF